MSDVPQLDWDQRELEDADYIMMRHNIQLFGLWAENAYEELKEKGVHPDDYDGVQTLSERINRLIYLLGKLS